jgi:hypothetical protein
VQLKNSNNHGVLLYNLEDQNEICPSENSIEKDSSTLRKWFVVGMVMDWRGGKYKVKGLAEANHSMQVFICNSLSWMGLELQTVPLCGG